MSQVTAGSLGPAPRGMGQWLTAWLLDRPHGDSLTAPGQCPFGQQLLRAEPVCHQVPERWQAQRPFRCRREPGRDCVPGQERRVVSKGSTGPGKERGRGFGAPLWAPASS